MEQHDVRCGHTFPWQLGADKTKLQPGQSDGAVVASGCLTLRIEVEPWQINDGALGGRLAQIEQRPAGNQAGDAGLLFRGQ